ncbi:MAG: hypothetical protein OS130_14830 [Thermodesulfobacteriota bacterium]|jgi:hypothetical protein|nr:MAG: hypothetical protein OS130_14830 [Thermodesulfobacteriota bacterium]
MKRKILIALLGLSLTGLHGLFLPEKAFSGDVDVHIGIGVSVLPMVMMPAPPAVVLIPNTPVYYAPDMGMDMFFYSGYWYRRHHNYWFRAAYYNGPWMYMSPRRVPAVVMNAPYHKIPPGHMKIPYGQLKKHWEK